MVFSSLLFLYVFFPLSILIYMLCPGLKAKNVVLMVLSMIFYAWGEPVWVVLLVFSALMDYTMGRIIDKYRGRWQAKAGISASVTINLALLCTFKYLDFFLGSAGLLIGTKMPALGLTLPIGISFYTFQTLSYTIDIYQNKVKVQKSLINFMLFVSLFPQLIAGPILRYADIGPQLDDRKSTLEKASRGIVRFACGLGKKVLIANVAGRLAGQLLDGQLAGLPMLDGLFGILMYAFQIYFDFSGYSDMAIGLGSIFGFDYSENFRYPYMSRSITEFWRRWHISLSSFFRDYVYIPLGGNRKHQILNLFIVWGLTGLWHGAGWNFVLWGLYYFVFLVAEKFLINRLPEKPRLIIGAFYTFPAVVFGWVLFYFVDFSRMIEFFKVLFGGNGAGLAGGNTLTLWGENLPLLLICILSSLNIGAKFAKWLPKPAQMPLACTYAVVLLLVCTQALVGQTYNPFLYFRF
jgi:alginate O-acetyltransferase complex protein AlgI